jgi:peptidyl-prolyl cis-trans isomerase D
MAAKSEANMLSQVRSALKGAGAWFVVILLILAFALWGVPSMGQLSGTAAVTVGGKGFSQQYVQNEFNRALQSQRNESGGSYTREDALASGLHNQIVTAITTTSALDQFADKMQLAMPRELVRDYLQENENFQNPATGKFDPATLQSILQQNNLTVKDFEIRLGEDLKRNQLINALAARAPAPDPFVEATLLRDTERRDIGYLIVTDEMSGKAAEPMPADLEAYYQENPAAFTAPEYRSFDLLILKNEDFREGLEAPEEEMRRLYDINKERLYDKPERRTVYQITYKTDAEALAASTALRQGKPFENIASERGLDLAAVTFTDAQKRDILDPAVADAAFADELEAGAITDPVRSSFGWTVVQIANITPPETTTFEDVRADIEAQFLDQDTRRALLAAVDAIEEVRDSGAGLRIAAEEAGLEVQTIGPIDRYSFTPGGAIIDKVPGEALSEVFALDEDEESEALELAARDGYFFVALREIKPPAIKPYADVQDDVDQRWRKQERLQRISATVRDIRDAVAGGQTLNEAASQFGRTPTQLLIDRRFENEAISSAFNQQIFTATKGDLVSGPAALGEAQVITEIRQIGYSPNQIPPEQVNAFEQYLGYQLDQELVDAFIVAVRDDFDVKINQTRLDAIFSDGQ